MQDDRYYIISPTPPFDDDDDDDVRMMDLEQHLQEEVAMPSIQRCGSDIVEVSSILLEV